MSSTPAVRHKGRWSSWAALFVSSLCVGWLVGLSASPILHVIVGSVIALIVAIVGALAGIQLQISAKDESEDTPNGIPMGTVRGVSVNPLPVAVFAVGLALGATTGISARTNEFFGPNAGRFVKRWQGIGLTDVETKRRLFEELYPAGSHNHTQAAKSDGKDSNAQLDEASNLRASALTAALLSVAVSDCQLLAGKHGDELRARLLTLNSDVIQSAAKECKGDDCLNAIRMLICPK